MSGLIWAKGETAFTAKTLMVMCCQVDGIIEPHSFKPCLKFKENWQYSFSVPHSTKKSVQFPQIITLLFYNWC